MKIGLVMMMMPFINYSYILPLFPYSAGVDLQHNPAYASTMTKDKTDSANEVVYEKCT